MLCWVGEVEVCVYGLSFDKVYFYELVVIDLIVDIVGVVVVIEEFVGE